MVSWRHYMNQDVKCGMLIKHLNTVLEKKANKELSNDGLTLAQFSVLISLYQSVNKQCTLKELEQLLHLAQSTTAGIVARLEQKSFVEYVTNADDRRVKLVRITSSGEQFCKLSEKRMIAAEDELLSGLTNIERDHFLMLLQKISNTLK